MAMKIEFQFQKAVQVNYKDSTELFQYPTSLYSTDCSGTAFIGLIQQVILVHKQDVESSCYLHWFPKNAVECTKNAYLDIRYYINSHFSIGSDNSTATISTSMPTELILAPQWNGTSCNNVVTSVDIKFQVEDGTIKSATGSFQYTNINEQNYNTARFMITVGFDEGKLEKQQEKEALEKSRNSSSELGYNLDELIITSGGTLRLITDPYCDQKTAVSVKFGINTITGCLINLTDCRTVQTIVSQFGNLYTSLNISVAPESQIYAPITVHENSINKGSSNKICTFATSLSIQLFYARNGPFNSYRRRLINVVYRYDNYETIDADHVAVIPFIFSVQFFDVTQPPKPRFAQIPSFNVALPSDFFYPFLTSSNTLI
uniref:Tectonic-3 n=1 Tax=Syphacia muris TaxID=451379 RepID=A0A0N5AHT6_9BILA